MQKIGIWDFFVCGRIFPLSKLGSGHPSGEMDGKKCLHVVSITCKGHFLKQVNNLIWNKEVKNRKNHVKLPFIYLRCKNQSKDYILTKGTNL